ncbi:PREDICTED: stress response protein NST1-like [Tarenaya hassleriana]|uniref:stress response protein NST1-like n=1 Tax=Tarenaya hassleriana TaxID=28532 RepID=UPI00053C22B1|nr:PREDICTED: stress response protein NST1-like [Tarenaya hassleriana]
MDPKETRKETGEDHHLESEEGSSGEGKSSEPRKEESSNSFVSAEEDPEENPSEESRRNSRETVQTSKEDTMGDEIQEIESPEEKIQETDAEIPEEPMKELPSVQLGQEKSKDAEIEVVADSASETEVLKAKEDDDSTKPTDEPEVDSRAQKVESKKPKAKIAERKGKVSDYRVIAEQRARTRSQLAAKPVVTAKSPPKKVQRKIKSQLALVITEHKTPKKPEKRKAELAKDMPQAKFSKLSKEYQKEKMKGKRKVQEESEILSSPSGSEDEELLTSLCMSHHFVDEKSEQRFNDMKNLNMIVERNVNVSNLKEQGIWDILECLSLEETVTYACPHSKILIKEFYANITKKIVKAGDPMYHRVYIRGKILHFSPAVINKILGLKNTVVTTMDELDREIDQKEVEIALTDTFDEKRKGEIA